MFLFVVFEGWSKGVGVKFLENVFGVVKKDGFKFVYLDVYVGNFVFKFYECYGMDWLVEVCVFFFDEYYGVFVYYCMVKMF